MAKKPAHTAPARDDRQPITLQPTIPSELAFLFDKRPLIPGEEARAYDDLVGLMGATLKPADIQDWLDLKEVVDLAWEAQRWRGLTAKLLEADFNKELTEAVRKSMSTHPGLKPGEAEAIAKTTMMGWSHGQANIREKVSVLLEEQGLDVGAIMSRVLVKHLDEVERIGRMAGTASARRQTTQREFERRRDAAAERRRAAAAIEVARRAKDPYWDERLRNQRIDHDV